MVAPLFPVTQLDANLVIQHVYDESKQALRTTAIFDAGGSDLDVAIDHTEDSIAIGTSADLFTSTTVGSKVGLDVSLLPNQNPIATTPIIINVAANSANTEYSYTFTANTKKILIRSRLNAVVQYSYAATQSGTNFITIPNGCGETLENLNLNGVTIYFQTTKNSNTLEIQTWT